MTAIQSIPERHGTGRSPESVTVTGRETSQSQTLLTPSALQFLAGLSRRFEGRRQHLLRARILRQSEFDHGMLPRLAPETKWIRQSQWHVGEVPPDLRSRRVEIAGTVDRKTMVQSLKSAADLYMADLEDGTAPTWSNVLRGHLNLADAAQGVIGYEDPEGTYHGVNSNSATLTVRPRGWHLVEGNVRVDGRPMSAALFDTGLYAFHNAHVLRERGTGTYFYLPKLESYFEARLWNDVFGYLEKWLSLPPASIKVTALIETVNAAFQMDEILFELRERIVGMRHGRWDYIFSFVKTFRNRPEFVMPDRAQIDRRQRFLQASFDLMIQTCHRRGAYAIGGKVAQVPVNGGSPSRERLLEQVMQEMLREIDDGFDGTQVIHPGIADMAKGLFDARVPNKHQIDRVIVRNVAPTDLLARPEGDVTEAGLRANVRVTLRYLASWLGGVGSVVIDGVVENVATVEVARTQVWQWIHHGVELQDGRPVTPELVRDCIADELVAVEREMGLVASAVEHYEQAARLATDLMTGPVREFMTELAYEQLG